MSQWTGNEWGGEAKQTLSYGVPNYQTSACPGGNCSAMSAPTLATAYSGDQTNQAFLPRQGIPDATGAQAAGGQNFMGTLSQGVGALSSLANIYFGFQQIGLAKKQYKLAADQWSETKKEIEHTRAVRKKISESYFK